MVTHSSGAVISFASTPTGGNVAQSHAKAWMQRGKDFTTDDKKLQQTTGIEYKTLTRSFSSDCAVTVSSSMSV